MTENAEKKFYNCKLTVAQFSILTTSLASRKLEIEKEIEYVKTLGRPFPENEDSVLIHLETELSKVEELQKDIYVQFGL